MWELENKTVIVCDYPSQYLFPPLGYGGIERWLWTTAEESVRLGMKVILMGPQWRHELLDGVMHIYDSIMDIDTKVFLEKNHKVDFLIGGHEYWVNGKMLKKFRDIARCTITYQHGASLFYKKNTFDNTKNYLFCYSDEMIKLYADQRPTKLLCVSSGFDENPIKSKSRGYLIFIGRIDSDKSPHYAVLAAKKLKMPIYIVGESVRDKDYIKKHKNLFCSEGVIMKGVVWGAEKSKIISEAVCGIYTLSRDYIEPAAGTIAEIIRSGVPLAGMSWKGNDAVCEPIKADNNLGTVALCVGTDSEDVIVDKLVGAIKRSMSLDRDYIYKNGNKMYNPKKLVQKMYNRTMQ